MQHLARSVTFAKAIVDLDKDCGGREDGRPDLEVRDAAVMKELRLALLDAYYDGPDLDRSGPGAAYDKAEETSYVSLTVEFASESRSGEDILFIQIYETRFAVCWRGFYQDSFQSARLARLIKDRLLPREATKKIIQALDALEQKGKDVRS
jgi:hypothetical protein